MVGLMMNLALEKPVISETFTKYFMPCLKAEKFHPIIIA
jgi:hypothetical protein